MKRMSPTASRTAGILLSVMLSNAPRTDGAPDPFTPPQFIFTNVCRETGLQACIDQIQAHSAAWGDVDGDGRLDLFVGAYYKDLREHPVYQATKPPVPGRIYCQRDGAFTCDTNGNVALQSDSTAAVLVDFDNDGDLDLFVSNYRARETGTDQLFDNDGHGRFSEVSDRTQWPTNFASRGIGVLDYDHDGLLDLFLVEGDRPVRHSRLYRNLGNLAFRDATTEAGLPTDINGLGVATGDVTGNGWTDLFVAGYKSNRLFVNDIGKFREVTSLAETFRWDSPDRNADDMACGACFGDVNGDGRPDLLVGHHNKAPWKRPEAVRLYMNMGMAGSNPVFRLVSDAVGLTPLPTRAPVVEIRDFDNDGRPDVYTTIVVTSGDAKHPVIFRNTGITNGLPQFRQDALALVDFPRPEHANWNVHAITTNSPVRYFGVGPSSDFDGDGRLDFVLPAWWPRMESWLMRNETAPENHWIDVQVIGSGKVNRQGIGSKVNVYRAGGAGRATERLGRVEIGTGYGYAGAQEAVAHFGLGAIDEVDVAVETTDGRTLVRPRVKADRRLVLSCP